MQMNENELPVEQLGLRLGSEPLELLWLDWLPVRPMRQRWVGFHFRIRSSLSFRKIRCFRTIRCLRHFRIGHWRRPGYRRRSLEQSCFHSFRRN